MSLSAKCLEIAKEALDYYSRTFDPKVAKEALKRIRHEFDHRPVARRPKFSKIFRESFWREWRTINGMNCHYCKREINREWPQDHPGFATIDHVIPLSKGGTNDKKNLVWSCKKCNGEKGDIRYW